MGNWTDFNDAAAAPAKPEYRLTDHLPNVPALLRLKERPQWVAWDYVWKPEKSKWDKVPKRPTSGGNASVSDPTSWGTYEAAFNCAQRRGFAGVGYVITDDDDLTGIDLDHCIGEPWFEALMARPETYTETSPSGTGVRMFADGKVKATMKSDAAGVEVYKSGRFLTVTGHHVAGAPDTISPAPNTLTALEARVAAFKPKRKLSARAAPAAGVKIATGGGGEFWRAVNDAALEHRDLWVPVLFSKAKKHATGVWRVASADLGRDLEEDISIHPDGIKDFGEEQPRTAIDMVQEFGGAPDAKAAAFWLCEKMGIEPTALGWQENKRRNTSKDQSNEIDLTEDGVALHFTAKFSDKLRFDHDQGRWFQWTGDHWKPDGTHLAYSFCRQIARELSEGTPDKDRKTVRKAAFAAGVERMARSDRAHAVTSEQWDTDPFLLGCPGVTIDLRTGQGLRPDPVNGITRQVAVAPAKAECPLWIRFLNEACEGDTEMIRFLQQWAGYCLTGDTREHALLFIYGPGGNGKSVFQETMAHILGDYAATSSMDTFTASKSDRHPTDLAMLRGARAVSASETEEGRAWAESRIKQLTGGDQITARFMRQDFFTYTPQFKLTVVGNHKPVLRNVDDAARRRFNIVPFTVKPKTPDPELVAKLKAEAPAILQWMIEGCLDWRRNGLVRPRKVLDATAEYFDEQDLFGQWLEEACRIEPENRHLTATPKELFEAWSNYALAAGEQPGTQTAMGNAMTKRGLRKDVRKISGKTTRLWQGIELHRPDVEGWQDRD